MEFMNVKAFSETSKDLYEAVKEYSRNSKEDMEKLINKAFAMEVAKQSGMALPTDMSNKTEVKRYSENPMVKFFANQIRDVMIDMILPDVLMTGAVRYFADIKYTYFGDTIKFLRLVGDKEPQIFKRHLEQL